MSCYAQPHIDEAALAHLGERQTEVHFMSRIKLHSGGTVFDPQKRHSFCFCPLHGNPIIAAVRCHIRFVSNIYF